MPHLRLSPSATVTVTPTGVMLRSDLGSFQVSGADVGAFLERIVPLCDGTRDRDAIQAALSDYAPSSVADFLDLLLRRRLLEEAPDAASPDGERLRGQDDFLRRWPGSPPDPAAHLARARVLVAGLEPWGATAAVELTRAGVGTVERVDVDALRAPCSLIVGAVAPGDTARMERVELFAAGAGVSCLWAHVARGSAFLGPLSVPGHTACRLCVAVQGLNPALEERGGTGADAGEGAAVMGRVLGQLVALEVIKVISGYTPSSLGGRVLRVDAGTLETTVQTLVRMPWCRGCGVGARGEAR